MYVFFCSHRMPVVNHEERWFHVSNMTGKPGSGCVASIHKTWVDVNGSIDEMVENQPEYVPSPQHFNQVVTTRERNE